MLKYISLKNPYFYIPLFLLLSTYFVLRALYVNPFCDEIGTFLDYVETGNTWEEVPNFSSANNHLLVTFIARLIYNIAGNNMFLFRLISLFSFVLFFFISLRLIRDTVSDRFNVLVFIGIISISWINDFFSYARGYAFAISLFFASIYLFIKWKNDFKIKWFIIILILSWLTVFANLAFLNSVLVLLAYSIVLLIVNYKKISKLNYFYHFTSILLFILALLPLIFYSFELKEAGALWWGNNFGWWQSTIKVLVELTFLSSNSILFYVFWLLFIAICVWTIYSIINQRFLPFIHSSRGIITVLFFGHIILTELLVIFVGVNYPSDRVAIIYVLLFLLIFSYVLDSKKYLKPFLILYLFFPITFLLQLNLDSSSYMQHTRITSASFDAIEKEINNSKSIDIDGLVLRNYMYEMRSQKKVLIANVQSDEFPIKCFSKYISDVNNKWKPSKYYQLIYSEPRSNTRIYRYTKEYEKKCVFDSVFSKIESQNEFFNIIHETIAERISPSHTFQISLSGSVFFEEKSQSFNLTYALKDSVIDIKMYNSINIVNYCEFNSWLNFEWESPIYISDNSSDIFKCYFYNPEKKKFKLRNLKVKVYDLNEKIKD